MAEEQAIPEARAIYNKWQAGDQRSSTLERLIVQALLAAELRGREQQKEADAARILSQRYVPEDMRRQLATAIRQ